MPPLLERAEKTIRQSEALMEIAQSTWTARRLIRLLRDLASIEAGLRYLEFASGDGSDADQALLSDAIRQAEALRLEIRSVL